MSQSHQSAPKPRCTPCWAFLLFSLVVFVVASSWVVMIVEKVLAGAGMEHCCTIEGVPFNYLGIFVLLCGVVVVLLLALAFQVRDWLLRRDFERKYGVKVPASAGDSPSYGGSSFGPSMHGYDHHDGD